MTRSRTLPLVVLIAAAALPGCAQTSAGLAATDQAASTAGLDTALLFDAQYYVDLYPDLKGKFGNDQAALRNHWLTLGIAEHRRASPIFDCNTYFALNPDLVGAFGSDCAAAMTHFRDLGLPVEGRRAAFEFDAAYYLATYPDLRAAFGATGYQAAASHFVSIGLLQEGRAGSNEFDVTYYVCHNGQARVFASDLRGAVEHWARLGLPFEGLRGSAHFDIQTYRARNPDVAAISPTDLTPAMVHWLTAGIFEGRSGDPGDGGGGACAAQTGIDMHVSTVTSATGFPTTWFGFQLPPGQLGFAGLNGTVSMTNSANIFSEILFIIGFLPSGACPAVFPASTPQFGPPGISILMNTIVKAPTGGTFQVPANFTLPGNPPISNCLMIGLNGGTVGASHPVTSASNLGLRYTSAPSGASLVRTGGEFCFGQSTGCQRATTNNALSFATVQPIPQSGRITAMFGDISDSTFDGTSKFGPPPTGPWTATNDFYIYHAAACAAVGAVSGIAGPGNFYAQVPADAIHLLSVPVSGNRIGASHAPVFQLLSTPVTAGDCLVTLYGMQGSGAFDNETQVSVLIQ